MAQTRPNKIVTITNDEAYDLATHLARMADSANVIVNVYSQAEADAITPKYAGLAVRRLDLGVDAIDVWTGTAWFGARTPFGHAGITGGFLGGSQNPVNIASVVIRGGVTFDSVNKALVAPVTGWYDVRVKAYFSGGQTGLAMVQALVNGGGGKGPAIQWTKTQVDEFQGSSAIILLNANDKISLMSTGPSSIYGSDGYNGTWVQIEYKWPNT